MSSDTAQDTASQEPFLETDMPQRSESVCEQCDVTATGTEITLEATDLGVPVIRSKTDSLDPSGKKKAKKRKILDGSMSKYGAEIDVLSDQFHILDTPRSKKAKKSKILYGPSVGNCELGMKADCQLGQSGINVGIKGKKSKKGKTLQRTMDKKVETAVGLDWISSAECNTYLQDRKKVKKRKQISRDSEGAGDTACVTEEVASGSRQKGRKKLEQVPQKQIGKESTVVSSNTVCVLDNQTVSEDGVMDTCRKHKKKKKLKQVSPTESESKLLGVFDGPSVARGDAMGTPRKHKKKKKLKQPSQTEPESDVLSSDPTCFPDNQSVTKDVVVGVQKTEKKKKKKKLPYTDFYDNNNDVSLSRDCAEEELDMPHVLKAAVRKTKKVKKSVERSQRDKPEAKKKKEVLKSSSSPCEGGETVSKKLLTFQLKGVKKASRHKKKGKGKWKIV